VGTKALKASATWGHLSLEILAGIDWMERMLFLAQDDVIETPAGRHWSGVMVELPERFAGWLHQFAPGVNDRVFRLGVCLAILGLTILLRRGIARFTVRQLKRISGGNEADMDQSVLNALRRPFATLLMVCGVFAALSTLRLPAPAAHLIESGARVAFIAVLLWGCMAAGAAAFAHAEKSARTRELGIGAFLPLIKKIVGFIFVVFSVLVIADALGADVRTFLAGLGIGGLAVALAAQDTIANMFGSFVVVMDHPFHVGDTVRIGTNEGTVEDIGLRSTRLRTGARTLIVMPNKMVATEAITNLSRMPQRRVDQTIGLTYDTTADQMEAILGDLRGLLSSDPAIHPGLIAVNFINYGESTLDIQIVYFTADPAWQRHLDARERINLKIMRAVAARGLQFAFPTQTVIHQGAAKGGG
jgi:MscS family membrane protein